jgi:DNA polymerase III subunit delta
VSDLEAVYLMAGNDTPKIGRALRRLLGRVGGESVERLHASEATGEDAVAACNALGLFAGSARLVLVEGVERWKAADAKVVGAYAKRPAPGTVLALVGGELKKDSPLEKALKGQAQVRVWNVPKRGLADWVAGQFELLGATADREACRALVGIVGDNLEELATEIQKLASWAGGDPVHADDVGRLAAGRAGAPSFALTDAWGRRDLGAVLAAAESLLERSDANRLVSQLAGHVGRVRSCRALDEAGVRPREAAGRLKIHPFAAEKALEHSRNYSSEELRAATVRLADVDVALKGGSRLAGDLELELALIEITRPAAQAAPARDR